MHGSLSVLDVPDSQATIHLPDQCIRIHAGQGNYTNNPLNLFNNIFSVL